jgi:oligogalacturonide lyase
MNTRALKIAALAASMLLTSSASAQLGKRWPSEKKEMLDAVTGAKLTFLTSAPSGDNTLYQTHQGWTADGKWIIFRSSDRAEGQGPQAFAVNEQTGVIVQITGGSGNGFGSGALNVAQKSMKVYFIRNTGGARGRGEGAATPAAPAEQAAAPATQTARRGGRGGAGGGGTTGVFELDLAALLKDSEAGTVGEQSKYERLCGVLPPGVRGGGGFGLDANEEIAYLAVSGGDVGSRLPEGVTPTQSFGPRNMGAGPSGIRAMNLKTGEVTFVVDVPVQMGHLQANPFNPGEIIYCWETGGKAPTRAWVVNADGTNNRPVYNEAAYDWVTHETVATKDEVVLGILGHRRPGTNDDWGPSGTKTHPTGITVANLRTGEVEVVGQVPGGSVWHVNGSYDGRWLVADDFQRQIWVWDRKSGQRNLISTGHRTTAADHPHPIFNPAGTEILVQSAMIAPDERAHDLCIIHMPTAWLNRAYSDKAPE